MYICKLSPTLKDYLWGGTRLKDEFGYPSELSKIAEAWVLSCHKDGQSIVTNGEFKGLSLSDAISAMGAGCLGTHAQQYPSFPILIKFIDAKDNLSIQVHPDDAYARRVEGESGKTECWYVMDCDEDATLIYGFQKEISREEFRRRIESDTLLDVLNTVKVKKGDLFFIESGTIHAIGKGTLIAEIQQNSNSTYRVYDYNRKGADGKPRELHVDKAVDVSKTQPPTYPAKPQGEPVKKDGCVETLLVQCDLFRVMKYEITGSISLESSSTSFVSVVVAEGEGTVDADGATLSMKKGDSFFIPAGLGEFSLSGQATVLVTTI